VLTPLLCLVANPKSQVDLIGNAESDATEIVIEEGQKYVAIFDPLDGSSNVDSGIPTGTILGVRRRWVGEKEWYH
jgi:fructose-1,6-bisphosphatase